MSTAVVPPSSEVSLGIYQAELRGVERQVAQNLHAPRPYDEQPNEEPLWARIRLSVGAFMNNLFRQGAFQGRTSKEAFFVKCDSETNTQADNDLGVVNIPVGFAPIKPAEFVVINMRQHDGREA